MKVLLVKKNTYAVFSSSGEPLVICKSALLLTNFLVNKYKFIKEEVVKALNSLIDNKHNAIEFGMLNHSFLFTKNLKTTKEQMDWCLGEVPKKKKKLHLDWFKTTDYRLTNKNYSDKVYWN